MIKPNAWKISIHISQIEMYETEDGDKALKEKLSNNPDVLGWVKRKRKVFLITDKDSVKNKFNTQSYEFSDLKWYERNKLLLYTIQNKFMRYGFIDFGRGAIFLPKSEDKYSFTTYKTYIDGYINFAFEFTITERKKTLLLVVNPKRVITKDGNNYEPEFSRDQNSALLEKRSAQFRYKDRLNYLRMFKKLFGNKFQFQIDENSFLDFEEHDPIDDEVDYIPEPNITFGNKKNHNWPKAGLNKYGPLDFNESFMDRPREINVALVGTRDSFELLSGLEGGIEDGRYSYQGFDEVYSTTLNMGEDRFSELEREEIKSVSNPNEIVQLLLSKAIKIKNAGNNFDICLIELIPDWSNYFYSNGVDLHDLIKVKFSKEGILTQIITENSEGNISSETLENLALGIYFKSGGNPWRVESTYNDVAYIGISFGYLKKEKKRLVGVAELFDNYGQFISLRSVSLKEISNEEYFNRKDYHLSNKQLTNLVDSLVEDYRESLDGNYPLNLVIHKTNRFNDEERKIARHYREYPFGLSLAHIQTDHPWHLLKSKEPTRGAYWEISNTTALLYTAGIMSNQSNYFLPGCPLPILVNMEYSDNYSLWELSEQILQLTKLNFNSTNSYSKDPATLLHSRKIVNLLRAGMEERRIPKDPRFYL